MLHPGSWLDHLELVCGGRCGASGSVPAELPRPIVPPTLQSPHPGFHSCRCSLKMPRNPFAGGSVAVAVSASETPRAPGFCVAATAAGSTSFGLAWNRIRTRERHYLAQFPCRRLLLVAEHSGGHPGGTWGHVLSPASPAQPRAPPALATTISAPLGHPCTPGCCCIWAGGSSLRQRAVLRNQRHSGGRDHLKPPGASLPLAPGLPALPGAERFLSHVSQSLGPTRAFYHPAATRVLQYAGVVQRTLHPWPA